LGITISADDPRTIRALEIAADANEWLVYHQADGHEAYGVPSQSEPGRHYLVTTSSCDCPDFRTGLPATPANDRDEQRACKHMLAVRLYRELVRAQQLRPRSARPRSRAHLRLVSTSQSG
jgi:hypothetical protein